VGKENTFKPTIGDDSLHQDSSGNGIKIVNFATSKSLAVNSTMFPHRNIHKYTWTSPNGRTHNRIDLDYLKTVYLLKEDSAPGSK